MTSVTGMNWRLLVVEDNDAIAKQLLESIPDFVTAPDTAVGIRCLSFKKALDLLDNEKFDILILDLKDDHLTGVEEEEAPAGLEVFNKLRKTRFTPVVFYTALAHKVKQEQTSFVRVVEKTESIERVKEEVAKVFSTQLPALSRHIDELQRAYLWEFVGKHWKEFDSPYDQADIAYLLARRLALSLQKEARRFARRMAGKGVHIADPKNIHPMEMYVCPPVSTARLACDILKGEVDGEGGYWMVMTPSCDFEQTGRLHKVLIAKCLLLYSQPEFEKWKQDAVANSAALESLIGDNRKNSQSERFKFLPGTYFLPDLVLDFQQLKSLPVEQLSSLNVIASLDSPFAEAVLARFARYYGRLGTADIDKQVVLKRLEELIKK